jgi:hypothetical protein
MDWSRSNNAAQATPTPGLFDDLPDATTPARRPTPKPYGSLVPPSNSKTTVGSDSRGNGYTSTTVGNDTFSTITNPQRGSTGSLTSATIGGSTFTSGQINGQLYNRTETTIWGNHFWL